MLPHHFQRFEPQNPYATWEILESHQLSYDFHRELKHRQAFAEYCQWYHETAQQNKQELAKMNQDFSLFRFFFGSKN